MFQRLNDSDAGKRKGREGKRKEKKEMRYAKIWSIYSGKVLLPRYLPKLYISNKGANLESFVLIIIFSKLAAVGRARDDCGISDTKSAIRIAHMRISSSIHSNGIFSWKVREVHTIYSEFLQQFHVVCFCNNSMCACTIIQCRECQDLQMWEHSFRPIFSKCT